MSTWILKLFVFEFWAGMLFSCFKKDWPMFVYYLGGCLINIGVLMAIK